MFALHVMLQLKGVTLTGWLLVRPSKCIAGACMAQVGTFNNGVHSAVTETVASGTTIVQPQGFNTDDMMGSGMEMLVVVRKAITQGNSITVLTANWDRQQQLQVNGL